MMLDLEHVEKVSVFDFISLILSDFQIADLIFQVLGLLFNKISALVINKLAILHIVWKSNMKKVI